MTTTLEDAMDEAARLGIHMGKDRPGDHHPNGLGHLITFGDPQASAIYLLGQSSTQDKADFCRWIILKTDPDAAALANEAWIARPDLVGPDDPDIQRLLRHEIAVSELPPAKRSDALLVHAGDRTGREVQRVYLIEPPNAQGERAHTLYATFDNDDPAGPHFASRFSPLFLVSDRSIERVGKEAIATWSVLEPSEPVTLRDVEAAMPNVRRQLADKAAREIERTTRMQVLSSPGITQMLDAARRRWEQTRP